MGAISLAALVKLWISFNVYGTNDITSWHRFADQIYPDGLVTIYATDDQFNHPPAMAVGLWLLRFVVGTSSDWFPFFFRLPAILADAGSAYLVWKFALHYLPSRRRSLLVLIFAINPVSVMVSGFHGNTDPIFTFLILASAFILVFKSAPRIAGCIFGLALNVKIVPLILLPAFYFWLSDWKPRIRFGVGAATVFLAGFVPHFIRVPNGILQNVLGYESFGGYWGISRLLGNPEWFSSAAKLVILLLVVGYSYFTTLTNKESQALNSTANLHGEDLIRAIGGTYIIFLVFTPGFGVQYLIWLLPFSVFWGRFHLAYTILSSCFIYSIYTYWSGVIPWNYANSWEPKGLLGIYMFSAIAGYFTWLFLLAAFIKEFEHTMTKINFNETRGQ